MNKYSSLEQYFQKFVLNSKSIQRFSFDLEKLLYLNQELKISSPVFVLGLARSGTTTLLRILYETDEFETITYRDMPFVVMPRIWQKLSKTFHIDMEAVERAHGDSILVNYDSPESFEEVFWNLFSTTNPASKNQLEAYFPNKEEIRQFKKYLFIVANKSKVNKRYLSKNNNNVLRLDGLLHSMPEGKFLLLWRDPLQTAYSLFKQHKRFVEEQSKDPFILDYMNSIGHFEFGLNHRPFRWQDSVALLYEPSDPNYWLQYWIDIYEHLLRLPFNPNLLVSHYDSLCLKPDYYLPLIFKWLNLTQSKDMVSKIKHSLVSDLPNFDEKLVERATTVSKKLQARSWVVN